MTEHAKPQDTVRKQIINDPNRVLEDRDMMRALISADEEALSLIHISEPTRPY